MTVFCIVCRECGGLTTMEYADQHHGLCRTCTHLERPATLPAAIDHEQAQAIGADDDPIRRAIDREFTDWAGTL